MAEVGEHVRGASELTERDQEIARLKEQLAQRMQAENTGQGQAGQAREENERLGKQIQHLREEYEAKIDRLNTRIRELSGGSGRAPAVAAETGERRGFFRR